MKSKMGIKFPILFLIIIIGIIGSLFFFYGKYRETEEPVLINRSEEYFKLISINLPSDLINQNVTYREEFIQQYVQNKEDLSTLLISEDSEYNSFISTLKVIGDNAKQGSSILTSENYLISQVLKTDIGLEKATIVLQTEWQSLSLNANEDGGYEDSDTSGTTFYKLFFTKENGIWMLTDVTYDPFNSNL